MTDLSFSIGNAIFPNPIFNASGCFDPEAVSNFEGMDVKRLGAIVSKGATWNVREGNPQPRIQETASGMINFIGLENPGIEEWENNRIPFLLSYGMPVIINVSGFSIDEYCLMAARLGKIKGITALEINISCPNVEGGKIPFGSDAKIAGELISKVRKETDLPLIVKLTPNVTDIVPIAKAVVDSGADAISMINTLRGAFINHGKIVQGGYSGAAIKPVALCLINQVSQIVKVPIIGMGGIKCLMDVFEFFQAGATAVAVGTANFKNPLVMMEILDDLKEYCEKHNAASLEDLKERSQKNAVSER